MSFGDGCFEDNPSISAEADLRAEIERLRKHVEELERAYRVETMRSARMADAMRDKDETRAAVIAIQAQQDAEQRAERAEARVKELEGEAQENFATQAEKMVANRTLLERAERAESKLRRNHHCFNDQGGPLCEVCGGDIFIAGQARRPEQDLSKAEAKLREARNATVPGSAKLFEELTERCERAEARLRECLWHANAMANMIRGFIFKTVERETLAEVAAKYRKWEEDDCHRTWRANHDK